MSETFTRHRATADRLITNYGGAATLVGPETLPDPVTGQGGGAGAREPIQYIETGYQMGLMPETLVERGDIIGIMAVPATFTPDTSYKIDFGGGAVSLLSVRPVQPSSDGAIIQYSFQARG